SASSFTFDYSTLTFQSLGFPSGLRDDVGVPGISWSANRLPEDIYPASGLALAAAYHDIKTRLASLERENSSIKKKLKNYEVKFPLVSEFGEERIVCCSCEPIIKDTSVIQSETTNLQQRINSLTQEVWILEEDAMTLSLILPLVVVGTKQANSAIQCHSLKYVLVMHE
uniref:Uncharacterized protein n=1 Tax=Echeneis naucrates TaxID=173247 RepID=A0A665UC17_ECHNA